MDCDLMFGCLGNGITVYDRSRQRNNDYVTVAHIASWGGLKLYDSQIGRNYDAMQKITAQCLQQQEDFKKRWFEASYWRQYTMFYESMTLSQQLSPHDDWPREKTSDWLYRQFLHYIAKNSGYKLISA